MRTDIYLKQTIPAAIQFDLRYLLPLKNKSKKSVDSFIYPHSNTFLLKQHQKNAKFV